MTVDWRIAVTAAAWCCVLTVSQAMTPKVSISCNSGKSMLIEIDTDDVVPGRVYAKESFKIPGCSIVPTSHVTAFQLPFNECGTHKVEGKYSNTLVIQMSPILVTQEDVAYQVECHFPQSEEKTINTTVGLSGAGSISVENNAELPNLVLPPASMRVYDFNDKQYASTLVLGETYHLEIDIADEGQFGGYVRNCMATDGVGTERIDLLDEDGCPIMPEVFGKAFPDDQRDTHGHYYLYMPFKAFSFPNLMRVFFQCNLVVCEGSCPPFDCGGDIGLSWGRKKRSLENELRELSVTESVVIYNPLFPDDFGDVATDALALQDGETDAADYDCEDKLFGVKELAIVTVLVGIALLSFILNVILCCRPKRVAKPSEKEYSLHI